MNIRVITHTSFCVIRMHRLPPRIYALSLPLEQTIDPFPFGKRRPPVLSSLPGKCSRGTSWTLVGESPDILPLFAPLTSPRSRDGLTLYAASSDGTVAVFDFDAEELEGIAPYGAQTQYLQKFGFVPPPVPDGYSHGTKYGDEDVRSTSRITPPPSPNPRAASQSTQSGFGTSAVNGGEYINRLVAKKSTKKRVQPLRMSSIPSAATVPPTRELPSTELRLPAPKPRPASPSVSPVPSMRGFDADIEMGGPMDMEVPIDSLEQSPESSRGKRKASVLDDEPLVKPRTLGGGLPRESVAVREIAGGGERWEAPRLLHATDVLPSPPILTFLSAKVDASEDVLEARNSEGDGPTEVVFVSGKQTQWLDYLPSPVVRLTASSSFCAVAMQDGSVSVYSHTGRR